MVVRSHPLVVPLGMFVHVCESVCVCVCMLALHCVLVVWCTLGRLHTVWPNNQSTTSVRLTLILGAGDRADQPIIKLPAAVSLLQQIATTATCC